MDLEQVFQSIAPEMTAVQQCIEASLVTSNHFLQHLVKYYLGTNGKRLRPALVLLTAKCNDYQPDMVVPAAAALELIHLATLVHDDIIDQAEVRHHLATINTQWCNQVAVLFGDYLYARALTLASNQWHRVVLAISEIVNNMVEGELSQMGHVSDPGLTEQDYLQRIEQKTAHFITTCCSLGAEICQASSESLKATTDYGYYLGMAFQIRDDVLDLVAGQVELGKPVRNDFGQGILTLPVIHALQYSRRRDDLAETIQKGLLTGAQMEQVISWLVEAGSLEYAQQVANDYVRKAKEKVPGFSQGQLSRMFKYLADFSIGREH